MFCLAYGAEFSGEYTVKNDGAYGARFRVDFELNGAHTSYNTGMIVNGSSRTIKLPVGASNPRLVAEVAVFIGWWNEIFSVSWQAPGKYCFRVWGSTLLTGEIFFCF